MQPKRSLGQNFLTSEAAVAHIIDAANISSTDTILEIGPGTGVLTKALLAKAQRVVALEKDRDLIAPLTARFDSEFSSRRLDLHNIDVLEIGDDFLKSLGTYKLVANIPYYITNAIIEMFLSVPHKPEAIVLLVQKEVADRIVMRDAAGMPGAGKGSILAMAVGAYCTPRYVSTVKAGSFNPIPKVDSAIVAFESISLARFERAGVTEDEFFSILKAGFAHKRKQLASNLTEKGHFTSKGAAVSALASCGISETERAESLTLDEWFCLARTTKAGR